MPQPLRPECSRLIPTRASRAFHRERNRQFGLERFESYTDWFYFIHVDPVIRMWHSLGMVVGLAFFATAGKHFCSEGVSRASVALTLAGLFFFYFLPLVSHYLYDGGTSKSTPDRFHSTLIPVVHINLMTLTGRYDPWLRRFIEKYPFTTQAWKLK